MARDKSNGIRTWLRDAISPATILWGVVIISGAIAVYGQITARFASIKGELEQLKQELQEQKNDMNVIVSRVREERQASEMRMKDGDQRLWQDISELRRTQNEILLRNK